MSLRRSIRHPPGTPTFEASLPFRGRVRVQVVKDALAEAGEWNGFYRAWHHYARVGSTMDLARERAQSGAPEGTIVSAEEQLAGRGRRGRGWHSPPGGAWFSLILRPQIPPADAGQVSVLLGVSLACALREAYGVPVAVKWPNDLWLSGRKLGGILVELGAQDERVEWAVVGVGINVNNPTPRDVPAISLCEALGGPVALEGVYACALRNIARDYRRLQREGFSWVRERWPEVSLLQQGDRVAVKRAGADDPLPARVVGLSPRGRLVVEWPSGQSEELLAEDVSVGVSQNLREEPKG